MSSPLRAKKVLLGITGGIAAYKAAELCRLFIKAGARVQVVMSAGAQEFITPLTLQALSGEPVRHALLDAEAEAGMGHIELAKWAELVVVAPASANFLAKVNAGMADDLLTTLLLATEAPIYIAPAMNQAMWANPVTQRNLSELDLTLGTRLTLLPPDSGEQACGDIGPGRLMEPVDIVANVEASFVRGLHAQTKGTQVLAGKHVLLTAGPTQESIDPVRYISNHSSGKMGFALAEEFYAAGARVTVIAGPVALNCGSYITRVDVLTADEMLRAAYAGLADGIDIFVGAAAVADYRPANTEPQKIKKNSQAQAMSIELVENPDVLASMAKQGNKAVTMVGFAAETKNVVPYARIKLGKKNLDMIVANDVSAEDIGFNSDDNAVTIVTANKEMVLAKQSKQAIAKLIVAEVAILHNNKG
jgi:phosphopantothenoylcysteine decarboxylase/phosphopantothenate--cysteine ligase